MHEVDADELLARWNRPGPPLADAGPVIVVDVADGGPPPPAHLATRLELVPSVLVALTGGGEPPAPEPGSFAHALDLAVGASDLPALVAAIEQNPQASVALALLLRGAPRRTIADGLVAESSTYSLLQAGPEHRAWLAARPRRTRPAEAGDAVRVERHGAVMRITLSRPHVRNAYDARTREGLLDALAVAALDDAIERVILDGDGPSFCSGGDLDEFGTLADPASAHLLRLARSSAWAIASLGERVEVRVHGGCVGAGVELPSFAGRVVARPDTTFRLPEVAMGLVPGAGGTVGITRRVGRHRSAWMAINGTPVDAATALRWGLVDEVAAEPLLAPPTQLAP